MMTLGGGIIGDIATPAERGGLIGLIGVGTLVSAYGLWFEKSRNGLSVRLVPVLVRSSEGLWLRHLVGGTNWPLVRTTHAQTLPVLFRSIFWFLCTCSTVCGLGLFLFVPFDSYLNRVSRGFSRLLPETLRAIVGDGSIKAGWIYTHPISLIGRPRSAEISSERPAREPFKNPLVMFAYPEIFVILIFNGILNAV